MKGFFRGNDFLYRFFIHRSSRYRYYLTCIIVLLIVSLWYAALYSPIAKSIQYYRNMSASLRSTLQEEEKAKESSLAFSKSIKGMERDIRLFQETTVDSNDLITSIVKEAINAKLHLEKCMTEPIIDYEWYKVQPLSIVIVGSIDSIARWLKNISDKTKLIGLSSAMITQIGDNKMRCSVSISSMNIYNC